MRGGSPGALCTSCETARPVRSKHCPMCDRCVLRFDHHCPWLANCVGAGNYKLYMLCVLGVVVMLGFYLALATTYGVAPGVGVCGEPRFECRHVHVPVFTCLAACLGIEQVLYYHRASSV